MASAGAAAAVSASGVTAKASKINERAIIDVHAHALLSSWLEVADKIRRSQLADYSNASVYLSSNALPSWSVEEHLRVMDAHGIATSVLSLPRATLSFGLKGAPARDLARAMNEEFASIMAKYPKRFGAFAVLPLDDTDAMIEETEYALDVLKLTGISSTTHVDGKYLGDERFEPWLAELNRRAASLFVHPVVPPAFEAVDIGQVVAVIEYPFDTTRMVANMIFSGAKSRHSRIKIIATHGGGTVPYLAHRIGVLHPQYGTAGDHPTLTYDEIFAALGSFYYDLTAATSTAQLDCIKRIVPWSRLLMGFYFPLMPSTTIEPAMKLFDQYTGFSAAQKAQIMRGNALSLFPQYG